MDALSSTVMNHAASAQVETVRGAASLLVLKKAMDVQAQAALSLVASVPTAPPPSPPARLPSGGPLGAMVDVYA